MIPDPTPADLARDAEADYVKCYSTPLFWSEEIGLYIRRAAHAEALVAELRKQVAMLENQRLLR